MESNDRAKLAESALAPSQAPRLTLVGATGVVGREMLGILAARRVPPVVVRLCASPGSVGRKIDYRDDTLVVEELAEAVFRGCDFALFCAGGEISRRYAASAVAAGATVVDNSSAFRLDPAVPLVIPEVNPESLALLDEGPGIIANPNCSTIILLLALDPLRRAFGIDEVVASTYQAVSGAGAAAMNELRSQSSAVLAGADEASRVFKEPCAFNVFSHDSVVDPVTGRNVEEQKMIAETRKIWNDAGASISVTCVRVPVMRAHAISARVVLARPATEADVREALRSASGLRIIDDRQGNDFPTSLKATGQDLVLVGRIRADDGRPSHEGRVFSLFVAGDQLRKGAALNAIQIVDLVS